MAHPSGEIKAADVHRRGQLTGVSHRSGVQAQSLLDDCIQEGKLRERVDVGRNDLKKRY